MSRKTKALVLDRRTLEAIQAQGMAYLHELTIVELSEETANPGLSDTTSKFRFVSEWMRTESRRPDTGEGNTSTDTDLPAPSSGTQSVANVVKDGDGVGLPVRAADIVDAFWRFPQPADLESPHSGQAQPSEVAYSSDGRAAETVIRCEVCRGRGMTLWVEQTWNLMDHPETELEECDNCQGSGWELVPVDKVAT